jgi:Ca2+-binding RTX toxin-like protein
MNRHGLDATLGVIGLALGLTAGAHWAIALAGPAIVCDGQGGGLFGSSCFGTQQADTITGSDRRDVITARNGDDRVDGGLGADRILGNRGNDELNGGPGSDYFEGGPGDDTYDGGPGRDVTWDWAGEGAKSEINVMYGGEGDDFLENDSPGQGKLFGGPGDESLGYWTGMYGGPGDDELDGGPGDDSLSGAEGNDLIVGGEGDDFLDGNSTESPGSHDTIDCGPGNDEVWANPSDTIVDETACEVIKEFDDPTSAPSAAERRAAEAKKKRAREAFLARRG